MRRSPAATSVRLSLTAAVAMTLACAQTPLSTRVLDPVGKVVDENGKPVAGAKVEFVVELAHETTWSRSIAGIVAATPLPNAVSDHDGDFVLPLTRAQRALGAHREGSFWLVVTMPGRRTWTEHLPQGLHGYLGSRVVLPKLPEPDPLAGLPWPPTPPFRPTTDNANVTPIEECGVAKTGIYLPESQPSGEPQGTTRLLVTVRDADHRPVPGAVLRFSNDVHTANPGLSRTLAITDAEGRATLAGLVACRGLVVASVDGFWMEPKPLRITEQATCEAELVLARTKSFAITIRDEDDAPVPFEPLFLQRTAPGAKAPVVEFVRGDSLGRLVLEVPIGEEAVLSRNYLPGAYPLGSEADGQVAIESTQSEYWLAHGPRVRQWTYDLRTGVGMASQRSHRLVTRHGTFLVRTPLGAKTTLKTGGPGEARSTFDGSDGTTHTIAEYRIRVLHAEPSSASRGTASRPR